MDLSRRDFMLDGAAFGGLVATAGLPAFAGDHRLFPRRGRFERRVRTFRSPRRVRFFNTTRKEQTK